MGGRSEIYFVRYGRWLPFCGKELLAGVPGVKGLFESHFRNITPSRNWPTKRKDKRIRVVAMALFPGPGQVGRPFLA